MEINATMKNNGNNWESMENIERGRNSSLNGPSFGEMIAEIEPYFPDLKIPDATALNKLNNDDSDELKNQILEVKNNLKKLMGNKYAVLSK